MITDIRLKYKNYTEEKLEDWKKANSRRER
jgi:hypothetical protein